MSKRAPLSYKSAIDTDSMRTVELSKRDADGNKQKESCPVFNGKGGLEGLLYVDEEFDSVIDAIDLNTAPEKFERYKKIFSHTALQKWKTIVSDQDATGDRRTPARFTACV